MLDDQVGRSLFTGISTEASFCRYLLWGFQFLQEMLFTFLQGMRAKQACFLSLLELNRERQLFGGGGFLFTVQCKNFFFFSAKFILNYSFLLKKYSFTIILMWFGETAEKQSLEPFLFYRYVLSTGHKDSH